VRMDSSVIPFIQRHTQVLSINSQRQNLQSCADRHHFVVNPAPAPGRKNDAAPTSTLSDGLYIDGAPAPARKIM
jgi:hypothetical protein